MDAIPSTKRDIKASPSTDSQCIASDPQQVETTLARIPSIPTTVQGNISCFSLSQQISCTESDVTSATATNDQHSGTELSSATSSTGISCTTEIVVFQIQKFYVCATLPMDNFILDAWAEQILPRLNAELLHNVQTGTWLPELLMVGKCRDRLKPCVFVTCGDDSTRKRVETLYKRLKWLREVLKQKEMTFLALTHKIVLSGAPIVESSRYQVSSAQCSIRISANATTFCGQRVYISSDLSQHSTYCTLGGVLNVGNRLYGLTAGHPFNNVMQTTNVPEDKDRASLASSKIAPEADDGDESPVLFDENESNQSWSPATSDLFFEDMTTVTNDFPAASLEVNEIEVDDRGSVEHHQLSVIRPVSSKLKMSTADVAEPDFDWALLDIGPLEKRLPNLITTHGVESLQPITNLEEQLPGQNSTQGNVTVLTATLGPLQAILNSAPASLKVNSCIFKVRLVILDRNLPAGSSGSWVVQGKKLCGHIIATRQDVPWAYMLPINDILQDIKSVLGTDLIGLPSTSAVDLRNYLPAQSAEFINERSANSAILPVSPHSPTQEEARRALHTLQSFFQAQPPQMLDLDDWTTIGNMMRKLKLPRNGVENMPGEKIINPSSEGTVL